MQLINKALFALVLALSVTNVFAACDTTDKFHLEGAPSVNVQNVVSSSGYLIAKKTGDRTFTFTMPSINENGNNVCVADTYNATATIAANDSNYCILTFRDGPFMTDPTVETLNCKGNVAFAGITYDGFMTYSYTIHLI